MEKRLIPGANPVTLSYNDSAVNIYNATSSLVNFYSAGIVTRLHDWFHQEPILRLFIIQLQCQRCSRLERF
jgi:hypothetical protein